MQFQQEPPFMVPISRIYLRVALVLVICLMLIFTATISRNAIPSHAAGVSITLSPTYGPPTSSIRVQGQGFNSGEMITITFDTFQVGNAIASSSGIFSIKFRVPRSALPGNHFVRASGTSSGSIAQSTFLVQTDWVQFGFNQARTRFNGVENVLNPTNVPNLTRDWTYTTDSFC
jgi:hypothetical protein